MELLRREAPPCAFLRRVPPDEGGNNPDDAQRIDPEWRSHAPCCDDEARKCRSDRTTDIEADAVEGNGGLEMLPRNELWNDRLPCRHDERGSSGSKKGKHKQDVCPNPCPPGQECERRNHPGARYV